MTVRGGAPPLRAWMDAKTNWSLACRMAMAALAAAEAAGEAQSLTRQVFRKLLHWTSLAPAVMVISRGVPLANAWPSWADGFGPFTCCWVTMSPAVAPVQATKTSGMPSVWATTFG